MASLIPAGESSVEVSVAELRERLADVLNTVAYAGTGTPIVYVTRHGRRIAAIVPASTAENLNAFPGGDSSVSELA